MNYADDTKCSNLCSGNIVLTYYTLYSKSMSEILKIYYYMNVHHSHIERS